MKKATRIFYLLFLALLAACFPNTDTQPTMTPVRESLVEGDATPPMTPGEFQVWLFSGTHWDDSGIVMYCEGVTVLDNTAMPEDNDSRLLAARVRFLSLLGDSDQDWQTMDISVGQILEFPGYRIRVLEIIGRGGGSGGVSLAIFR